jgi:hypothetical protein
VTGEDVIVNDDLLRLLFIEEELAKKIELMIK